MTLRFSMMAGVILLLSQTGVHANGRKPESEEGYPDYNRLEYRKKTPEAASDPVPPPPTQAKSVPPPVDVPVPATSDLDAPPKLPSAVPVKDDSEPAMPEDMMNTLTPGATIQK